MKKKLQKKLIFNKTTVARLDIQEQKLVRGKGYPTTPIDPCNTIYPFTCDTCETCNTDCGTCITDCFTCLTHCATCNTCNTRCDPFFCI